VQAAQQLLYFLLGRVGVAGSQVRQQPPVRVADDAVRERPGRRRQVAHDVRAKPQHSGYSRVRSGLGQQAEDLRVGRARGLPRLRLQADDAGRRRDRRYQVLVHAVASPLDSSDAASLPKRY
jgi:hypothetical protein